MTTSREGIKGMNKRNILKKTIPRLKELLKLVSFQFSFLPVKAAFLIS